MADRMRRGLPKIGGTSCPSTNLIKTSGWGAIIPIFGSVRTCHKRRLSVRRGKGPTPDLLREHKVARHGVQIPFDRETYIFLTDCFQEFKTLLSGSCHQGTNEPSPRTSIIKSRIIGKTFEVGQGVEPIPYPLRPLNLHQGTGPGRIQRRMHLDC